MGTIELNDAEMKSLKDSIHILIECTLSRLNDFSKIDPKNEDTKVPIFMNNLMNNYIVNLIIKASNGDIAQLKENVYHFTMELIDYFEKVLPTIERNLNNKEMH